VLRVGYIKINLYPLLHLESRIIVTHLALSWLKCFFKLPLRTWSETLQSWPFWMFLNFIRGHYMV
jgi:hypothetical protein